jgi:type IX secretion system PorP/SprF family membrane protein
MNMKKTILFISLITLSFGVSQAQQVPQFSQNMFNKLANNPAIAGSSESINANVVHRQQWMGMTDAPVTSVFSVESPFEVLHGGLGLHIVTDEIAQYSNLDLQISYAYQTQLGDGQLGIGLSSGIFQSGLDGTLLNPADGNDPSIPTGEISGSAMDFGGGLYYNTQDVYIGLSTLHMTEPTIEKDDGKIINLSRHYFLLAGYYLEFNPLVSLNPSIYLKSDGSTSQIDINTNIIYNKKIWGGVSYRLDEGIVLLTGMNLNDDLKFGIAYDVVLNGTQNNSLEFMLGYSFKVDYDRPVRSYKNPRYL